MLEMSFICKSLSFVCDSGVEVDIAMRDVGGLFYGIWIGGIWVFQCR
jgi:hypothetical protein